MPLLHRFALLAGLLLVPVLLALAGDALAGAEHAPPAVVDPVVLGG